MTEYFFEYKCRVCKGPNDPKDSLEIKMRLFQDYQFDGQYCVQVMSTLPEGCTGVRYRHIAYGVDVPTPAAFWEDIRTKKGNTKFFSHDSLKKNGGFFIKTHENNVLSGTGIFAFVKDENSIPTPEHTYVYAINFGEKQKIVYSIEKSPREIRINFKEPLPRNKINLRVYQSNKGKPLLKPERGGYPLVAEVSLEGRELKSWTKTIDNINTEGNEYRLYFNDQSDAKCYLLVDESEVLTDERVADSSQRLFNARRYFSDYGGSETPKCPYCFNPFKFQTDNPYRKGYTWFYGCNGAVHYYKHMDNGRETVVYCDIDYRDKGSEEQLSLYQNFVIPDDYIKKRSMHTAIIGAKNSGKSVMMSTILGARSILLGTETTVNRPTETHVTSYILQSIIRKLDTNKSEIDMLKNRSVADMLNFDRLSIPLREQGFEIKTELTIDNFSMVQKNRDIIKQKYFIAVGESLPDYTRRSDTLLLSVHPFGFGLGDKGYAYFYDAPGESVVLGTVDTLRTVIHADCLIVIIDGIYDGIDESTIFDSVAYADKVLSKAHGLRGDSLYNIPIAIVISKFDNFIEALDENCHIVRENMLKMLNKETFEGSEIERHINFSSYEIEQYLKSIGCAAFVNKLNNYKYLRFFAVSALGSNDCFVIKDYKQILSYHERPLRLELPLVWLMYQRGIIEK
jgi:hypothetical protein